MLLWWLAAAVAALASAATVLGQDHQVQLHGHDCPERCATVCQEPQCEHTVLDQCGCCPVCVRQEGERCGGDAGVCAAHLRCTQHNDENEYGTCTGQQTYTLRFIDY
ncbi:hypothetical protein COOONC_14497 [Cooperia oncophora]